MATAPHASRSWPRRARVAVSKRWRSVGTSALLAAILGSIIYAVANLPSEYVTAMQAVGSLAILGVTAIYASHTRRQVDLMSRTYRAQVSAPRLASLREFASHVPEWSREHRGLLANVNLIASFTSMSGAVTFPAARRSIDGFFGHIDNQAHPRIIEQIERLNVDLPDAISQAAQRAADAARQDAIWIAMFVATVGQELASPDPHGRSHEKLPEVWKAMQSVSPATLPTWDSLTATPLETSLSAAFVELQQVLNEALIAAREDT